MRVKALKTFRDKHTKVVHEAGSVFRVNKDRAAEMNTGPAGVLVEEVKEEGAEKEGE